MSKEQEKWLSNYEEISIISDKTGNMAKVSLVKDKRDGRLCIKKHVKNCNANIVKQMINIQQSFNTYEQGVPKIIGYVEQESDYILIEDYINAPNLAKVLETQSLLPKECASIMAQVCKILSIYHNAKPSVIHRDVKPENILVDLERFRQNKGEAGVYVIDFDSAKLLTEEKSKDTHLMGTMAYAAPEQFGYAQSDARTDVYGIGATMRECVKHMVFSSEKEENIFLEILNTATKISMDERYQNVEQLQKVLEYFCSRDKYLDLKRTGKISSHTLDLKDYTLPGFRTKKLWKMIVAIFVYYTCFSSMFYSIELPDTSATVNFFAKICMGLFATSTFLLATNYLDMWHRLWLLKDSRIAIKIIGVFVYLTVVMFILVVAIVFFDYLYLTIHDIAA